MSQKGLAAVPWPPYPPAVPVRRDTLVAAQYFTAVAGMAAMRSCLTGPSAVRDRLEDVRRVVEHLDEFPNNLEIPVIEYDVDLFDEETIAEMRQSYVGLLEQAIADPDRRL